MKAWFKRFADGLKKLFSPVKSMFDSRAEIMGWLVCIAAAVGVAFQLQLSWQYLFLAAFGVLTILGTAHYAGVSFGPSGFSVDEDD